jgi:hypothetical protein
MTEHIVADNPARVAACPALIRHAGAMPSISSASDAVRAAVAVAASFGVKSAAPAVLADGANVIVHLSPSPVVAKVASITPLVRPDTAAWLQRELDVASFLARCGAPVGEPSPEIPATTHAGGGGVMSFWRYLGPGGAIPDEETIGSMLRDLHGALRGYSGAVPALAPLGDVGTFLARPETRLSAGDKSLLAAAFARLTAELGESGSAAQVLHSDAGAGNLMAAGSGWVWHDFEDTCTGPVAWDLAASTASQRMDGARVLSAYGADVDPVQLAICQQLRLLHLTVWYSLYAERFPRDRERAAELLAIWRTS